MKQKGFTLIELLVSMTIVAILATIGFTIYSDVQKSARDAKRKSDLNAVAKALEQYKTANGSYPYSESGDNLYSCWDKSDWYTQGSDTGTSGLLYTSLVTGNFIQSLPSDPINSQGGAGNYLADLDNLCYIYNSPSDGSTFNLGTNLELVKTSGGTYGNYQIKNQL